LEDQEARPGGRLLSGTFLRVFDAARAIPLSPASKAQADRADALRTDERDYVYAERVDVASIEI